MKYSFMLLLGLAVLGLIVLYFIMVKTPQNTINPLLKMPLYGKGTN